MLKEICPPPKSEVGAVTFYVLPLESSYWPQLSLGIEKGKGVYVSFDRSCPKELNLSETCKKKFRNAVS